MIFFSTLLRRSVYDCQEQRLGSLHDICITLNEIFPVVTALIVHHALNNTDTIIPWSQIESLETAQIHLLVQKSKIHVYTPQPDEILVRRDILDKQIVDTQGVRVVKVNDLKLVQVKRTVRLIGVDIGLPSLLRRLGILTPVEFLCHALPIHLSERTIAWNYVEPIQVTKVGTGQLVPALARSDVGTMSQSSNMSIIPQVQLNVSHTGLADLHPADIADILEQLNAEEAGAVLDRLDTETAADILSEVEPRRQSELLYDLEPARASHLLEQLAPDDAADILAGMTKEESGRLLALMSTDNAQSIRDLLRHGAETAGGIMTPEVLALPQDCTVEEALTYLRQHSDHLEMVYYLYVIDGEHRLLGVASLRHLVITDPVTHLQDIVDHDIIKVTATTGQEEVAHIIAKYDLLGVPVVDNDDHLIGVVTVDDIIDVIHEEQAKDFSEIAGASIEEFTDEQHFSWYAAFNRLSWLVVNVVIGFIIAVALNQIVSQLSIAYASQVVIRNCTPGLYSTRILSDLFCVLPMLLLTSGSVSTQALGVAGWQLRSTKGNAFWHSIFRELRLGTSGGVIASVLVGLLTWFLFHSVQLGTAIGLGFGCTLLIATICGLVLPTFLQRLRLRGSLASAPLINPTIALISVGFFLLVTLTLVTRWCL